MKTNRVRLAALLGVAMVLLLLQACQVTTQRVVEQGFQIQDDRVMFLYHETPSDERGLLECSVDENGAVYDCRDVGLVFNHDA